MFERFFRSKRIEEDTDILPEVKLESAHLGVEDVTVVYKASNAEDGDNVDNNIYEHVHDNLDVPQRESINVPSDGHPAIKEAKEIKNMKAQNSKNRGTRQSDYRAKSVETDVV